MTGLEQQHDRLVGLLRQKGYEAGDVIPSEPELAAMLNVSRQSVREALAGLQTLGVVEGRQGARRRLCDFNPGVLGRSLGMTLPYTRESLLELLEVRRILERSYLPRALGTLNVRKIRRLRDLTDRMSELAAQGKIFLDEDEMFHTLLFEGLENSTLDGLLTGYWHFFRASSRAVTTGTDLPRTAAVHAVIVDAIEAGDVDLTGHRLDAHFFDVRHRVVHLTPDDLAVVRDHLS